MPAAANTPNFPKGSLEGSRAWRRPVLLRRSPIFFFFFLNFLPYRVRGFPASSVPEEDVARGRVEHGAGHGASSGSRFLEPGKVRAAAAGRSASSHRGRIFGFGGASQLGSGENSASEDGTSGFFGTQRLLLGYLHRAPPAGKGFLPSGLRRGKDGRNPTAVPRPVETLPLPSRRPRLPSSFPGRLFWALPVLGRGSPKGNLGN